jgi:hypothetical protein
MGMTTTGLHGPMHTFNHRILSGAAKLASNLAEIVVTKGYKGDIEYNGRTYRFYSVYTPATKSKWWNNKPEVPASLTYHMQYGPSCAMSQWRRSSDWDMPGGEDLDKRVMDALEFLNLMRTGFGPYVGQKIRDQELLTFWGLDTLQENNV